MADSPDLARQVQNMSDEMVRLRDTVETLAARMDNGLSGWNRVLEEASSQLKVLFNGTIPKPILRKLVTMAFKGHDDMKRDAELKVKVPHAYE